MWFFLRSNTYMQQLSLFLFQKMAYGKLVSLYLRFLKCCLPCLEINYAVRGRCNNRLSLKLIFSKIFLSHIKLNKIFVEIKEKSPNQQNCGLTAKLVQVMVARTCLVVRVRSTWGYQTTLSPHTVQRNDYN